METENNKKLKERERRTKRLAEKKNKEMKEIKRELQEVKAEIQSLPKRSKEESTVREAQVKGEKEKETETPNYESLLAEHIVNENVSVVSQSFSGGALSAIFAESQKYEKPDADWGIVKGHKEFLSRFGNLGRKQKKNLFTCLQQFSWIWSVCHETVWIKSKGCF